MGRPAVETAASDCETARGGLAQPPPGGLADEARNVQLPDEFAASPTAEGATIPTDNVGTRPTCRDDATGDAPVPVRPAK